LSEENNKIQEIISKNINIFIGIALISIILGAVIGAFGFPQGTPNGCVTLVDGNDNGVTVLSESDLKTKTLEYLNSNSVALFQSDFDFEITDFNSVSDNLYSIAVSANKDGESLGEVNFYVTPDGKKIILGTALDLDEDLPEPEVPEVSEAPVEIELQKSDKPKVELFVMSYCPYGTQSEKGILPVLESLGDSIDFKLRFVDYVMHSKIEIDENTRDYCIQKEQTEKFVPYLTCFLEAGNFEECLVTTGVDVTALDTCIANADSEFNITANFEAEDTWLSGQFPLYDIDKSLNEEYKVQSTRGWGSPGLVLNGKLIEGAPRNADGLLSTICQAFNNTPDGCSAELSSTTPTTGFGFDDSTDTAADGGCGV